MPKKKSIQIELGQFNPAVQFSDLAEIERWHQSEKKSWQWVQQSVRNQQPLSQLWQHLSTQWQEIDRAISSTKSADVKTYQQQVENTASVISQKYSQNRLLTTNSPRGIFVIEKANSDPILGAHALRYFVGLGIQQNDYKALEGAFIALQFDKGIESNVEAERKSLNSLKAEWQTELSIIHSEFTNLCHQLEQQASDAESATQERQDNFKAFLAEAEESKNDIEQTYRENMALQAPVDYWQKKAVRHNGLAKGFGIASAVAGVTVAGALGTLAYNLLLTIEKPDYWRLAVLGIFTTLGVWLVRILIRLFLSNLHQGSDAEERVTMVQTFLSLMSEGHIEQEEDRQLVLQALFRSTSTGLIKDEAAPPTLIDITNTIAGKK